MTYNVYNWKENEQLVLFFQEHGWLFLWLLPSEHKANQTKDNKNGMSLFAELKPFYANSVWITKNNVKANIWKLYMKFEANKEFMENLSLQRMDKLWERLRSLLCLSNFISLRFFAGLCGRTDNTSIEHRISSLARPVDSDS